MTIICAVSAQFKNPEGDKFTVTGRDRGVIMEAPEWIKETLLFKWLLKDGSIKFVTKDNRISAENEPLAGLNAEGKEINEEDDKEPEAAKEAQIEQPKRKYTRKKKDDA